MTLFAGTFARYLARHFFVSFISVFTIFVCLIFLIDFIELLRRASKETDVAFAVVLEMAILKGPSLTVELLPFAVLFGGLWSFSRLTKNNELVVARATGVSAWQFLAPSLITAFLIGAVTVTIINPLAATMAARFERLEAIYLERRPSMWAFSSTGIWLRQADRDGQTVIHALSVDADRLQLKNVMALLYEGNDHFKSRIDADSAELKDGYWALSKAILSTPEQPATRFEEYRLATSLTADRIEESFAGPETLSFWALPDFVEVLEEAGFSAVTHRIHWHSLLALPVLLSAVVLLSALFSLRLSRFGYTGWMIAAGVLTGFVLYFVSDLVTALGLAGNLPVILAAWTPAGVSLFIGAALMFHLEDG